MPLQQQLKIFDMGMKNKNIEDFYPLSPMQQGIFFHSIAAPESSIYFEQFSWTIQGNFSITAFRRAWEYIVERHSILRTCFVWSGLKEPVQVVHRQVKLPWVLHDWREIPSVQQQQQLTAFLESDRSVDFELTHPPLMRFTLHHLAENFYHFTWSHHHILLDGWSGAIIYKEVFDCYQAFSNGQDIHLEPVRSYRDYIVWVQQQNLSRASAFWRQLLKGFTSPTRLSINKGFGQLLNSQYRNHQHKIELSLEQTAALQFLAKQHQLTMNTFVQGVWALLLSRYSGQEDVVFGATTSGRPPTLAKAESMVGLLINTLPVRVQVSSEELLLPWLKKIQAQQLEARQYEYSPLVKIQGWSEVPKGLPLFENIVIFENYPVDASLRKLDLSLDLEIKYFSGFEKMNYTLTLVVSPGKELSLKIYYDSRKIDADAISNMLQQFEYLLQQIVTEPDRSIQSYSLVTPQSRPMLPDLSTPLDESDYEQVLTLLPKDIPTNMMLGDWALPQTQALILNQTNQLCGIGEIGEIVIRTPFRTLDYINATAEQQQRCVPNPLTNDQQDLFYYTGDKGRYRPDGSIEVLGWLDDQIQIRGIGVQPGEIETVLNQHPAVAESVVIATEDSLENKRLIAYLVAKPNQTIAKSDLRYFLKKQLPEYLVPSVFMVLNALPLTASGKVNRRALPPVEQSLSQDDRFVPPRDRLELDLTQIWSEVLNANSVGVLDNFFELGGHSLLAVSLMARIHKRFGQSLPLKTLFQEATVEQQAMLLRQQTSTQAWSPLVTIQPRGSKLPLLLIHPNDGSIFNYLNLVQHLGTDRPLYGLEASGRDQGQEPHSQIEEMAADYIKAIQTIQPEEPYLLVGWFMGAAIAFEMAQQLQDRGLRISLLALIDASDIFTERSIPDETDLLVSLCRTRLFFSEEQLQQVEANLRQMDAHEQLVYVISQAREHNPHLLPPGFGVEQLGRIFKIIKFHTCALKNYSSQLHDSRKYYSGKLTLFQAIEELAANSDNRIKNWEALADKVEVHSVPGNYRTILQEPYVKVLAEKLQICLALAEKEK